MIETHPKLNGRALARKTLTHIKPQVSIRIAYIPNRYVILVLPLVTRSVLLLNTLVRHYQKSNPDRFSIEEKTIHEKTII